MGHPHCCALLSPDDERSSEAREGLADACSKVGWGVAVGFMDFKDRGGRVREGLEGFDRSRPVDGAVAGPEVFVFEAVVVVDVDGDDAGAESADGLGDAHSDVGMAEVETDADLIEVAHL